MHAILALVLASLFVFAFAAQVTVSWLLGFDWLGRDRFGRHHDHLIPRAPRSYRAAH